MSVKQFLNAANLIKSYGERRIFEISSLSLFDGQRVGLVGGNGAGKSTLISVLAGIAEPDEGRIVRTGRVAVICQDGAYIPADQIDFSRGAKLAGIFETERGERSQKPSGGERTRMAIAKALASEPDLLFADEPTTNLDMDGIVKLQSALLACPGALVLVSHDRELLNTVCTEIWELEAGALRVFPGNFSAWLEQKARERDFAQFEYDRYRSEKKRLITSARKMSERAERMRRTPKGMSLSEARLCGPKGTAIAAAGGVSAKAKSALSRAEMLEVKERPRDLPEVKMALGCEEPVASRAAVRVEGFRAAFGDRVVLRGASFELLTGKRTVMLGRNGSGKTTILDGIFSRAAGVTIAPSARVMYFNQNFEALSPEMTALQNARSLSNLPESEVRTILARLGFKKDDVHKKFSVLSGGERAKVAFARLFASNLNVLLLDEPTNHIDIYTSEELENLLSLWRGTLLVATHDRRLARKLAQRLLFVEDGEVRTYEGTWEEYGKL